jgi:hypothetical protein
LEEGLSVRDVEALSKTDTAAPKPPKSPGRRPMSFEQQRFKSGLSDLLGRRISLKTDTRGKGSIIIPFDNDDDLRHIADALDF